MCVHACACAYVNGRKSVGEGGIQCGVFVCVKGGGGGGGDSVCWRHIEREYMCESDGMCVCVCVCVCVCILLITVL